MPPPRVLFVIPCYNHGAFVREAVDSARAQTDADIRIVIIDDGSDDGSTPDACDACADERTRVVHQANAGLPAARNAGIQACDDQDHDRLVFLDADDTVEPDYVARLSEALDGGDERTSHAYCQERIVVPGSADFVWRTPAWDPDLVMLTNLHPVTALVRREALDAVGRFDPWFREGYEDWELWIRMALAGYHGVRVEAPLFVWQRRGGAESLVESAIKRHDHLYAHIVEKHRDAYLERAETLLKQWNHVARAGDVNWLDAEHKPVTAAGVARHVGDLETWLKTAQDAYAAEQAAHAQTRARLDELESELDRLKSVRGAAKTLASRVRSRMGFD